MHFINPYFLFGFFAIGIPILVHLFNFRRYKTVFFSNLSFLKELQQETKKQSQLKHILILIARILAICCLVMAFAQPYLSKNNKPQYNSNLVNIYIDNSFSMESSSLDGNLFNEAVRKAKEIALKYHPSDIFHLITNDLELKHASWVNRDEFLELLNGLKISPASKNISEIIKKQLSFFDKKVGSNKLLYVLSDFQKNSTDVSNFPKDSATFFTLLPIQSKQVNNVYIDTCWLSSPMIQKGQSISITCRIKNASNVDVEKVPLKLSINNAQKAIASVDIKAGEALEIPLNFMPTEDNIQQGEIEITDYPIVYDDKLFFSFSVETQIPIQIINQNSESNYLSKLFINDTMFHLQNSSVNNLDYQGLKNFRVIILNGIEQISESLMQELLLFTKNGGSLVIFPAKHINSDSYHLLSEKFQISDFDKIDTGSVKISEINFFHPLYRDVFEKMPENIDLPKVNAHYILKNKINSLSEPLLKMNNGDYFACTQNIEKGKVYLFATPVDVQWSSLFEHAIWVPTLLKITFLSLPQSNLFYNLNEENDVIINNFSLTGDANIKIKSNKGNFEMIPSFRNIENNLSISFHQQIPDAGNYVLLIDGKPIKGISFNFNRKESDRAMYTPEELNKSLSNSKLNNYQVLDIGNKPISKEIIQEQSGFALWKIFVILTLLFFTIETLLIRFLK